MKSSKEPSGIFHIHWKYLLKSSHVAFARLTCAHLTSARLTSANRTSPHLHILNARILRLHLLAHLLTLGISHLHIVHFRLFAYSHVRTFFALLHLHTFASSMSLYLCIFTRYIYYILLSLSLSLSLSLCSLSLSLPLSSSILEAGGEAGGIVFASPRSAALLHEIKRGCVFERPTATKVRCPKMRDTIASLKGEGAALSKACKSYSV